MPKTNSRAIGKLLEAHKILKKQGRSADTSAGQAFALDLVRHLETGKPGIVTYGGKEVAFKPSDVRVSRTRVSLGNIEIGLTSLQGGEDGEYEAVVIANETDQDRETVPVRIEKAA
mgnify:CR=1 FL=1